MRVVSGGRVVAYTTIAFFDAKYTYDLWRPVTAIQMEDTDNNGQHFRFDHLAGKRLGQQVARSVLSSVVQPKQEHGFD